MKLDRVFFYTGIPEASDDPLWHQFWVGKLAIMGRRAVHIFSRPLRYRNVSMKLPDGRIHSHLVGQEKGVDIRIALDIVRLAHQQVYDVALVFSQDQDLSEVAEEIRTIGREQNRWIKIERSVYDACIDPTDYRPRKPRGDER